MKLSIAIIIALLVLPLNLLAETWHSTSIANLEYTCDSDNFAADTLVLRFTELGSVSIEYDDGSGWDTSLVMHGGGGLNVSADNAELFAECSDDIEFRLR